MLLYNGLKLLFAFLGRNFKNIIVSFINSKDAMVDFVYKVITAKADKVLNKLSNFTVFI